MPPFILDSNGAVLVFFLFYLLHLSLLIFSYPRVCFFGFGCLSLHDTRL